MGIVHGDLSSRNFMIHRGSKDVRLIDFDSARMKGQLGPAVGNPDFIMEEVASALEKKKTIKAQFKHDLYQLALCCYLVIDLNCRKFYESLVGEQLTFEERERLMDPKSQLGLGVTRELFENKVTAEEAAIKFRRMWNIMNMDVGEEIDDT